MVVTLQKVDEADFLLVPQNMRFFQGISDLDDLLQWSGMTGPKTGTSVFYIPEEALNRLLLAIRLITTIKLRYD